MLATLIFFPLLAAFIIALFPRQSGKIAFIFSLIELLLSFTLLINFNPSGGFQFVTDYWWIKSLGISFKVGVDGIGLLLVLLTNFLIPLIILSSLGRTYKNPGLFYSLILAMQFALVGVFSALDGFLFYVFWELALIPIYLICLIWGGENRFRITLKFFIYTLTGSLLMLVALIWLWFQTPGEHTFDMQALYALELTPVQQGWIFWGLFLAFAIKMPVFPFHSWQPDTYVDAPTPGTMLLSGIMLKMGVYGLLRWLLPVVPEGVASWGHTAIILSVIGILYASCIAFVQKDFKRLIAYSSIAHVGLICAGVFSLTFQGLQGSVIQMISHGINVVGLFFIAEIIHMRTQTREMETLGGIRQLAPRFSTAFIIVLLASIALPFTNGFIGEFLLLNGLFQYNVYVSAAAGVSIILGAAYSLRAYQKISLGETAPASRGFSDLAGRESAVLIILIVAIFFIGLFPDYLLNLSGPSIEALQKSIQMPTEPAMIKH